MASSTKSKSTTDRLELQALVDTASFTRSQSLNSAGTNVAEELAQAMREPVDFPPLNQTVFPGDTVAIVVQPELPSVSLLLDQLIREVLGCQIEPLDVIVVVSRQTAGTLGIQSSPAVESGEPVYPVLDAFHSVRCHVHDPDNENDVAYLAANREGLPVVISRPIAEADVVIPLGAPALRKNSTESLTTVDSSMYPTFSSRETLDRFRDEDAVDTLEAETRLANDQVGVFSGIQIVPGCGEKVSRVFAGERHRVAELAQNQFATDWSVSAVDDCDLLIVTLEGDGNEQTWEQLIQAVIVGSEVASTAKQIVIWSELKAKPTREIKSACEVQFEADDRVRGKLPVSLRRFADVVGRSGIFLKSGLSQSVVEGLGFGYVGSAKELSRMVESANAGMIVMDAHRCLVNRKA